MPAISTLGSPGIEIREFDESLRTVNNAGTTVFIPGFASQGPVEEINPIGSMDDFETLYGQPTNAAERYFYYTVKSVLDSSGNGTTILTSRLPYGSGDGDNVANAFTLLAYPTVPVLKNAKNTKGFDYYEIKDDDNKETLKSFVTLADELEPTEVSANIIINSKVKIEEAITLKQLVLTGLPTATENAPFITYKIGDTEIESQKGTASVEYKSNKVILHFAFILVDNNGNKIGIATIDAEYDKTEFEALTDYTIVSNIEDEGALELNPAYVVGDYYSKPEGDSVTDYSDITYLIGAPATFQISLNEYYQLLSGELFAWSNERYDFGNEDSAKKFGLYDALKHSAFIALNPSRTIVNDGFEGYYLGMTDNIFNLAEDGHTFNAINSVKITTKYSTETGLLDNDFQTINKARLDFYLDSNNKGSISQVLQNELTSFDTSGSDYDDTLNIGLFKIKKSTTASEVMKLTYSLTESYNASLGKSRQYSVSTSTEPKTYFIENLLEDSLNLTILVNPFIAENIFVDVNNNLRGKVRIFSTKLIGNMERYEKKYITNYTTTVDDASNTSSMTGIRLAQSNINSWTSVIDRAGVSLSVINNELGSGFENFTLCDSLYQFGIYTVTKSANKIIGSVPSKLERTLNLVANDEEYPDIDIIVEGGLGTVYAYANTDSVLNDDASALSEPDEDGKRWREFDDTIILNGVEDMRTGRSSYSEDAQNVIEDWTAVQNAFLKIANSETNGGRGNTFYIADIIRGIVVKGKNTKISSLFGTRLTNNSYGDEDVVNHSWSTSIYYPIKHLTDGIVSSFTSIYAQFFKILDNFSGEKVWQPASGYIAGRMCAVDQLTGPWEAAAGLNRGGVPGVLDVAISPTLSQRSDLYKICVNSIPNLPNVGPTIWGIRTMSKKASAFDQNTCRRTFLYIEKVIKQTLRYFIFERNDSYTQLQVYNELEPFLDSLKKQRAIYSYTLVCDSSNNTEEIINNGDMVVDVAASPERTAENIILNVTANRYTQSVESSLSTSA